MQFFHTPIDSSSSQLSIGGGFIITAVIDRPVERMNGPHLRSDGPRAHNFSRSFSPAVISFASHVIDILIAWKRYPQRALPNELSPVPIRPYSEEPDLSKAHGSWNCFVQTWNFLELHQLFLTAVGKKTHGQRKIDENFKVGIKRRQDGISLNGNVQRGARLKGPPNVWISGHCCNGKSVWREWMNRSLGGAAFAAADDCFIVSHQWPSGSMARVPL